MAFYKLPLRDSAEYVRLYDYVVVEADGTEFSDPVENLGILLYNTIGEFDDDQPAGWAPEELTIEQALESGRPIFTVAMCRREN